MMVPQGAMVKQGLLAFGVDDPAAHRMVDRLTDGGLGNTQLKAFEGTSLPVPTGADTLLVTGENAEEELTLLLVARKKTGKTLDPAA